MGNLFSIDISNYNSVTSSKSPPSKYKKDDFSFNNKEGICYIDNNGISYSYKDLYNILMDEDAVKQLYEDLRGKSPEEELKDNWLFKQCKRCGNWMMVSDSFNRWYRCYCIHIRS